MDGGATFLATDPTSHREHLWVVLSEPKLDPNKVLIVNLTSTDDQKERVCVVESGEHSWVTHESCANYRDSRVTTLARLYEAKDLGLFKFMEPVSPGLLARMREGAALSQRIPFDNAEVLAMQGLIDI